MPLTGEAKRAYNQQWRKDNPDYKRHWRETHPEADRAYREAHPDKIREYQRTRDPDKVKARYTLNNAISAGTMTKQPCEVCGAEQVHGHHEDYSKPFDVIWLCTTHHADIHWPRG